MEAFSALLVFSAGSLVTGHRGQWRGALMFSLILTNGWVNNREAGDLRRHRAYHDVTVMVLLRPWEASPAITVGKLVHSYMISCNTCSCFSLNLSCVAYYRHSSWWINIFPHPYSKALLHCYQDSHVFTPASVKYSWIVLVYGPTTKCRNKTKTKQLIRFMGCMVMPPVFQVFIPLYSLRNIAGWDIIIGGSLTRRNDKFFSWFIFLPSKYLCDPSELI